MKGVKWMLVCLFLAILIVGCTQLTAEQIAEKMQEKYNSIKDMKGTMVVTTNFGKKQTQTINFEMKKPNKWKSENERMLTISNGKTMWIYDKQKNEVIKLRLPEIKQPEFDYGKIVKDMLEKYDLKLVGEEKVSNRDCYVIELKPKGKDYFINQKLWVDKDYCIL
ncbi:MAG: outer membrane lipoprotein carrier protein LolA [Archaeoglobus sp.]|nr:outer membrane lipoprotein carrier protein LolA [Archaeoglobus sp.]